MKKIVQRIVTICLITYYTAGYSQTGRYLNEVFSSVSVTSDVVYGNNLSVLTGAPTATDLKCDIYQPVGDASTARPLIILLHAGSFLPRYTNNSPMGSKTDSVIVEMCTRFAKRGYVAVAPDYRLGWNPVSGTQSVRTGTLLNAVYRVTQDAKNCVRFFRNDRATSNTYLIDTSKIVVGGFGSGAIIAMACASLNKVSELELPKFINLDLPTPAPYINQAVAGNFDGTNTTAGNTPNYPTYSSKINMVFGAGGAMGDTSWIEPGEVPVVGFHCIKDPYNYYKTGVIIVSTTGQDVVEVSGSHDILRINNKTCNNNQIFRNSIFTDPYTMRANQVNDGLEGLFPFVTPPPGAPLTCDAVGTQREQSAPWDWWDATTFPALYDAATGATPGRGNEVQCAYLRGGPNMSAALGRLYVDTLQGYLNPRVVCALGLTGCVDNPVHPDPYTGMDDDFLGNFIRVFPNPSSSEINFSVSAPNTIQKIELYDMTGRLLKHVSGLQVQSYTIQREGLISGFYISKIILNTGVYCNRIIFE